ncbi:amino acid adenylation domain-containing protein [Magnetococcus sp. PR-3]|uniref:amino acid adenylation domain-containing protein n=1 Tax=Magnetococcus sp. PR-3 TaxID=3120355 RepID=UPI002FCDF33D
MDSKKLSASVECCKPGWANPSLDVGLLHHAVSYWAEQQPDHPAVDDGSCIWNYGALAQAMVALAAQIGQTALPINGRVALFMDSRADAILAMLGTLQAGGCYVPIDPDYPAPRVAAILEDAEATVLMTASAFLPQLERLLEAHGQTLPKTLIVLDGQVADISQALQQGFTDVVCFDRQQLAPQTYQPPRRTEADLAYIIFTSGTTGRPKGVMLSHANVKAFIRWSVDYLKVSPQDRIANHASIAFDLSVLPIYTALMGGATLYPVIEVRDKAFPMDFIQRHEITIWTSVPSILGLMIQAKQMPVGAFEPHLRAAVFCGEAMLPAHAQALMESHPDVAVINLYGPTEAAVACTYHHVGVDAPFDANKPVPIGVPCRDAEIVILKNDEDTLCAPGELGRLMITGTQVAQGYWRRPELSAEKFYANPLHPTFPQPMYDTGDLAYRDESGLLHYGGRRDFQVKFRGFRIELGDIEATLASHPQLNEVAVVYHEQPIPSLEAAYTLVPGQVMRADSDEAKAFSFELVDYLKARLPAYMVPGRWTQLEKLPQNSNGKIDRHALKAQLEP